MHAGEISYWSSHQAKEHAGLYNQVSDLAPKIATNVDASCMTHARFTKKVHINFVIGHQDKVIYLIWDMHQTTKSVHYSAEIVISAKCSSIIRYIRIIGFWWRLNSKPGFVSILKEQVKEDGWMEVATVWQGRAPLVISHDHQHCGFSSWAVGWEECKECNYYIYQLKFFSQQLRTLCKSDLLILQTK